MPDIHEILRTKNCNVGPSAAAYSPKSCIEIEIPQNKRIDVTSAKRGPSN